MLLLDCVVWVDEVQEAFGVFSVRVSADCERGCGGDDKVERREGVHAGTGADQADDEQDCVRADKLKVGASAETSGAEHGGKESQRDVRFGEQAQVQRQFQRADGLLIQ